MQEDTHNSDVRRDAEHAHAEASGQLPLAKGQRCSEEEYPLSDDGAKIHPSSLMTPTRLDATNPDASAQEPIRNANAFGEFDKLHLALIAAVALFCIASSMTYSSSHPPPLPYSGRNIS